jgi:pSer/pThr/pTyr-binding forkhead associated (FHA) protein
MPVPGPSDDKPITLLEADEDILQESIVGVPSDRGVTSGEPFRPTNRPPTALLTIMDDGMKDGETIRLRAERFIIGRTEGDLLIPHDGLVSSRHVEILRVQTAGNYRWVVTDLQTRNGLFIRVSRTVLADGAEILVGRGRYRFEQGKENSPDTVNLAESKTPEATTGAWGQDSLLQAPFLAELGGGGIGARLPLVAAEIWIGSDTKCQVCRRDDPFTHPRHVRLARDRKGSWEAYNNRTANGLWFRVPQITVDGVLWFQIGEQRLRLKCC